MDLGFYTQERCHRCIHRYPQRVDRPSFSQDIIMIGNLTGNIVCSCIPLFILLISTAVQMWKIGEIDLLKSYQHYNIDAHQWSDFTFLNPFPCWCFESNCWGRSIFPGFQATFGCQYCIDVWSPLLILCQSMSNHIWPMCQKESFEVLYLWLMMFSLLFLVGGLEHVLFSHIVGC